jgi:hypothetical protein
MISSKEKKVISLSGGHVGLCISRAAQENLWPEIGKWILLHNSTVPKKEPRAPTEMITV